VYNWNLRLGRAGGSLTTRVDPSSAISMQWFDRSADGGRWITDVRLPLKEDLHGGMSGQNGGVRKLFGADVKVQRQFSF